MATWITLIFSRSRLADVCRFIPEMEVLDGRDLPALLTPGFGHALSVLPVTPPTGVAARVETIAPPASLATAVDMRAPTSVPNEVADAVAAGAQEVATPIVEMAAETMGTVAAVVTESIAPVTTAIEPIAAPVLQSVADVTSPIIEPAMTDVSEVVNPVVTAVAPVTSIVEPVVSPVVQTIETAVTPVLETMTDTVSAVTTVTETVAPITTAVETVTAPLTESVVAIISTTRPSDVSTDPSGTVVVLPVLGQLIDLNLDVLGIPVLSTETGSNTLPSGANSSGTGLGLQIGGIAIGISLPILDELLNAGSPPSTQPPPTDGGTSGDPGGTTQPPTSGGQGSTTPPSGSGGPSSTGVNSGGGIGTGQPLPGSTPSNTVPDSGGISPFAPATFSGSALTSDAAFADGVQFTPNDAAAAITGPALSLIAVPDVANAVAVDLLVFAVPPGGGDAGAFPTIPAPILGDMTTVEKIPLAATAAELLNRFLPYDPAALWTDVEGLLNGLSDALPDGDLLEVSTDWWYVLGALVLYTTVSRKKRRAPPATHQAVPTAGAASEV